MLKSIKLFCFCFFLRDLCDTKIIYESKNNIMKTMKYICLLLLLFLCFNGVVKAQNPDWILPPKYYDGINTYSLPTSPTSHNASNMQMDANGDILFYIVNNIVYDKDGDLIANLSTYYNANHPNAPYTMEAPNASEVGDCTCSG